MYPVRTSKWIKKCFFPSYHHYVFSIFSVEEKQAAKKKEAKRSERESLVPKDISRDVRNRYSSSELFKESASCRRLYNREKQTQLPKEEFGPAEANCALFLLAFVSPVVIVS